ncbi:MAG: NlpC/P60 family protein [Geobacteraceae bacterium]|nr:NlpC/P60 family protein [Geobacteraceae bacterium]
MRLIIPSHVDVQTKKAKIVAKHLTYKVVKGDTLLRIAKKTGVKIASLRLLNGLKGNRIKPGQVLALNETVSVADETMRTAVATKFQAVNSDLLNELEFNESLATLSDIDGDRPIDLAKNLEDSSTSGISSLKKSAYSFLGTRYRFGGGLDCSSFVQQVFREQKINLPRTAREQFSVGSGVMRGDLQKGDLVFFQTYATYASHVGIYLGDRKMIHASSGRYRQVVISSMDTPYFLSRFLGGRRIVKDVPDTINFNELLQGVGEERASDVMTNDTLGVSLNMHNLL